MVSGVIFQMYRVAPCFHESSKNTFQGGEKGERKKEEGRERKRFVSPQRRKNICQGWVRSQEV